MILAARIDLIERSADLHEGEADCLRRSHTLAPHHLLAPDDSTAQSEHDQLLLVAHQLRAMARQMRVELDMMERVTGTRHHPERSS